MFKQNKIIVNCYLYKNTRANIWLYRGFEYMSYIKALLDIR